MDADDPNTPMYTIPCDVDLSAGLAEVDCAGLALQWDGEHVTVYMVNTKEDYGRTVYLTPDAARAVAKGLRILARGGPVDRHPLRARISGLAVGAFLALGSAALVVGAVAGLVQVVRAVLG